MSEDFDPSSPDSYGYWIDESVRYADVDSLGHVNNNAFGVYFEDIRVHFLTELEIFSAAQGRMAVVARTVNEFKREMLYPARFRIGLRIEGIGNSSITLTCAVFHDGNLIATQQAVCVIVDAATHRPISITADQRQQLMHRGRPAA